MIEIIVGETDSVDWAIKTFRRKVQRSGILQDLRKKRFYVKPSDAKRHKAAAAQRRRLRARRRRR
ncbi:MAG: 30S ribosomal protein S21 [Gemmatimonadales bacterium]